MELRRWFQLFCILPALQEFLVHRVCSLQCPLDTHYLTTKQKCCLKCRIGEKVVKDCDGMRNTTCEPCPENKYQDKPNGETNCKRCLIQIKENRKLLKNCTRFHNKEYDKHCNDGFYLNLAVDSCQKCTRCKPGYGVKKECSAESNTECDKEMCGRGTYSDQESFMKKCMRCTRCKKGEEMYRKCTPFQNSECRTKNTTIRTTTETTIGTTQIVTTLPSNRPGDGRPTNASREDGRSWVMPFFVAAMVLLLILFVAFVIGVTVWCKIHTRNRMQNVIVQAEDPQIVTRLTKLVDRDESVCLVNEESRFLYHQVPDRKPGGIRENGMMLRDVSHDIIEQLANFLNPTSPPSNWRKVASMLDFPWNVINNVALCPTTATQQLLQRWGTKRDATVYKLYLILKDIGRDDAAEVLERLLLQPVPSCPKSI